MQLSTDYTRTSLTPPEEKQGLLFVLSAPSGTGKDSVIQALKDQGQDFHVVASVTTRAPRPGEHEGFPYHFITEEAFMQMVEQNELIEHANVHGNWYGQPISQIREHLYTGRDVILKIDVQGAATVRARVPDAIFIFLTPGSLEDLATRLTNRQTETKSELERRLSDARYELAQRDRYDYVVVNRQGELDKAVEAVRAIILAEHCRSNKRYVQI